MYGAITIEDPGWPRGIEPDIVIWWWRVRNLLRCFTFFDNFQDFFQTFGVCHALSCTYLNTKPLPFRRKVSKLPPDMVKTRGLLRLVSKIQV